jgi:nicotinate-nucleotide adenylyltransferase
MCRAAFAPFGRRVRVLDIERRLPTPSFTVQTLEHLHERHPDWRLHLVIGTDVLPETPLWRDFDRVAALAPPIVLARGTAHPAGRGPVFPAISSTALRAAIREGRQVADLVPAEALAVAEREGLYRD